MTRAVRIHAHFHPDPDVILALALGALGAPGRPR